MNAELAQLDYSDLPRGSRLEVSRDEGGLVITDPAPGAWSQIKMFLFAYAIYVACFVAAMYAAMRYFAPRAIPRAWLNDLLRRMFVNAIFDLDLLLALLFVASIAYVMGRRSVTLIANSDQLVAISRTPFWPGRHYTRRRQIPRTELRDIRLSRLGARILIRTHRQKPRSVSYLIAGGRRDAAWTVRALRRELGLSSG